MKMAKASERDMEMALELSRALEGLMKGFFPDDGDDAVMFDPQDPYDCIKAIDMLFEIACKGSLFRVVFGMTVLLDPRNEVVDPDADHLELHPKHQKALERRDELLAAAKQALDECVDLISTPAGDALTVAIAKAEGRPHERPA